MYAMMNKVDFELMTTNNAAAIKAIDFLIRFYIDSFADESHDQIALNPVQRDIILDALHGIDVIAEANQEQSENAYNKAYDAVIGGVDNE